MGEIADMMLDGTLCQFCGQLIDEDGGDGIPTSCGCDDDDDEYGYKEMKKETRDRHARWKVENMKAIDNSGIPYKWAGNETILFRESGKPKVDYYPSTGRYRVCGQSAKSGGAKAVRFLDWYKKQGVQSEITN